MVLATVWILTEARDGTMKLVKGDGEFLFMIAVEPKFDDSRHW